MQFIIDGKELIYTLQYSKAKKMALSISPEGQVHVKAPLKTSIEEIEAFLLSNKKQLLQTLHRLENRCVITSEKTYDSDEYYLFLGKPYTLSSLLRKETDEIVEPQKELIQFYTNQTRTIIKERVKHYESIIGVKCKSVTIVNSPKSWGTCNNYKELTFNYRLSMAPLPVIDYVVIHELCHISHLNHDRSFWRLVGKYDSNYTAHTNYLAHFGGVMTI